MERKEVRIPLDLGELSLTKEFTFNSNKMTILVGPNGTGKTTLLQKLEEYLKAQNILHLQFSNYKDGGMIGADTLLNGLSGCSNPSAAFNIMFASEGQGILASFLYLFLEKLDNLTKEKTDESDLWLLLDALDSGLDIFWLSKLKFILRTKIVDNLLSENGFQHIFVVLAANSFELARNEDCLYPYTGNHIRFKNYEEYREFVLQQEKIINQRDKERKKNGSGHHR